MSSSGVRKRASKGGSPQAVSLEKKIETLSRILSVMDRRFDAMEQKMSLLADAVRPNARNRAKTEQIAGPTEQKGEQFEQLAERIEQNERVRRAMSAQQPYHYGTTLDDIRGRHREILAMLINGGFHTYKEMADKLHVSQSRVRAYIAELRNKYRIPLKQIRDAEGYKIGVELRFVEEILASK